MSFICEGCRDAADRSVALAEALVIIDGKQASIFDPQFGHDEDVCEDRYVQPSGCPGRHRPVTLNGRLGRTPEGSAKAI